MSRPRLELDIDFSLSDVENAQRLGVSVSTIANRRREEGVFRKRGPRRSTQINGVPYEDLPFGTLTYAQIAEQVGCSKQRIGQIAARVGHQPEVRRREAHPCKQCGTPTVNRVYCSRDCASAARKQEAQHGTNNRYRQGCRCAACRTASRVTAARYRALRVQRGPAQHGTATSYNSYGCRCQSCRTAHTTYLRRKRT